MEALGGKLMDGGMCGARGRTITTYTEEPVRLVAVFHRDIFTGAYRLELSLKFYTDAAQPHQVMEAAEFLTKHQDLFPFTKEETPEVFAALQERFGDPKQW